MCQDEWLNESVIPSANENATACATKCLRGVRTDEQRTPKYLILSSKDRFRRRHHAKCRVLEGQPALQIDAVRFTHGAVRTQFD